MTIKELTDAGVAMSSRELCTVWWCTYTHRYSHSYINIYSYRYINISSSLTCAPSRCNRQLVMHLPARRRLTNYTKFCNKYPTNTHSLPCFFMLVYAGDQPWASLGDLTWMPIATEDELKPAFRQISWSRLAAVIFLPHLFPASSRPKHSKLSYHADMLTILLCPLLSLALFFVSGPHPDISLCHSFPSSEKHLLVSPPTCLVYFQTFVPTHGRHSAAVNLPLLIIPIFKYPFLLFLGVFHLCMRISCESCRISSLCWHVPACGEPTHTHTHTHV